MTDETLVMESSDTEKPSAEGARLRDRLQLHENHIKVVCRVRPTNKRETGFSLSQRTCVNVQDNMETLTLSTKPDPKTFCFDYGENCKAFLGFC